ncbi:MAG: folylpolyglutamate synthase/dihydrofolate synthase family protein [Actinomycetaceae bacterium]|nr:folylpolyglutamate synthase/dihydrofolate synthase family protein [Actinomycetaceae bacterium]
MNDKNWQNEDAAEKFFASLDKGEIGGIDPELVPYLDSTEEKTVENPIAETEAIRNLVEFSLLAGPLPEVVEEVSADSEDDHAQLLRRAQEDAKLRAKVHQIYQQIQARAPEHDVQPSTARVQKALYYLGDPQNAYDTIHITGTNGKTSTARMIDALATAQGLKTGRFTSPHLQSVTERISLEGQPISADSFIRAWEDVKDIIGLVDEDGVRLSFFEVFTVMAYAAFADYPIDLGVIEVGMGGKWDATNTIDSKVQVITPISRDHEKWLGSTLTEIATEKAGIIKPGSVVVLAHQPEEAREILLQKAAEVGAYVRELGTDIKVVSRQNAVGGQLISVRTPAALYEDIYVPLFGAHQADNAAVALAAFEAYEGGDPVNPLIVEHGFAAVTSPGRAEIVRASPTIMIDAAHNPGGAKVLAALIEEMGYRNPVGVFSAMGDKDVEAVLAEVEPVLAEIVLVEMSGDRAMSLQRMQQIAVEVFGQDRVKLAETLPEALDEAVTLSENSGDALVGSAVIAFGSVVFVGEVRDLFRKGA